MAPSRSAELAAISRRAVALHQAGQLTEAARLYGEILAVAPADAQSLHLLGVLNLQRGDSAAAVPLMDAALAIDPNNAFAHGNRSVALVELGRSAEALASCDRAIALKPDHAEAHNNRGNALMALGCPAEALASFDRAIAHKADYAQAFTNRADALVALKRLDEALASADRSIALKGDHAEAFNNRGNVFKECGDYDRALADYDRAIALRPSFARARVNRGLALAALRRFAKALASYDEAIALKPDLAEAFNNRGTALNACRRFDEALASYDRAIVLKPDYADAHCNRANTLAQCDRIAEAAASYRDALSLMADHAGAAGGLADCASRLCDWTERDALAADISRRARDGTSRVPPLVAMRYCDDPELQLACARQYVQTRIAVPPQPLPRLATFRNARIRLAYLSADFRQHPVAQLTADLFERHDRARFEVIGISLGPDDRSALRARIERGFDRFHDAAAMSDRDTARLLHDEQIDLAVDLTGYTTGCRPEILSFRPAPLAVSYLGYPGTMGADFIDYIVADRVVAPFALDKFFAEKIVHLPDCYLANAPYRPLAAATPTRQAAGLPDAGFVFCCFNNHAKIAPLMFNTWMRLLGAVINSVLWLSAADDATAANLRREAAARGIDPARLMFAPRTQGFEEHLARHRLACLFLDTIPYNAHATASDALRAGLPVLTCRGEAMAGRVAASLLAAVGLAELVTANLADYEALAIRLATDPPFLAEIAAKLARNLAASPLFAADRFCRAIEAAYTAMWERRQRGEHPQSFAVPEQDAQGALV